MELRGVPVGGNLPVSLWLDDDDDDTASTHSGSSFASGGNRNGRGGYRGRSQAGGRGNRGRGGNFVRGGSQFTASSPAPPTPRNRDLGAAVSPAPNVQGAAPGTRPRVRFGDEASAAVPDRAPAPASLSPEEERQRALARELHKMKVSNKRLQLQMLMRSAQHVDMAFVMDLTMSMEQHVESVRSKINVMIDKVRETHRSVVFRLAFIGYRDFPAGCWSGYKLTSASPARNFVRLDFTDNVDAFKSFMAQECKVLTNGVDFCEDVFTGIEQLGTLSWGRSSVNLVFHIGDAPCHGRQYWLGPETQRYDTSDSWDGSPAGDPLRRDLRDMLAGLFDVHGVSRYYFAHITDYTEPMIKAFQEYSPEVDWLSSETVSFSTTALITWVVKSVSASVSAHVQQAAGSMQGVGKGGAKAEFGPPRELQVDDKEPNWASMPWVKAIEYKMMMPKLREGVTTTGGGGGQQAAGAGSARGGGGRGRFYELLEGLFGAAAEIAPGGSIFDMKTKQAHIKIAPRPFTDSGGNRWPFYGKQSVRRYGAEPGAPDEFEVNDKVFKVFRARDPADYDAAKRKYLELLEAQTAAALMAQHFNNAMRPHTVPNSDIHIVQMKLVEIVRSESPKTSDFYFMEPALRGEYVKYSSNVGTLRYHEVLEAFSHWSYQVTDRLLMVTDLQGIWDAQARRYVITDPAVHCDSDLTLFGGTNLGERNGIEPWFSQHSCGRPCRLLALTPHLKQPKEFVVDGCNVGFSAGAHLAGASGGRRRFFTEGLAACVEIFTRKKLNVTVFLKRSFFDAARKQQSEGMDPEDVEQLRALHDKGLLSLVPDRIHDDNQALVFAHKTHAYIVSDDLYRKEAAAGVVEQHWLDAHRIGYNWVPAKSTILLDADHPIVKQLGLNSA